MMDITPFFTAGPRPKGVHQTGQYDEVFRGDLSPALLATIVPCTGARGGAVVEALRYKPEGRGIDSRWCHWYFSLT
jgi:hypothetical protein